MSGSLVVRFVACSPPRPRTLNARRAGSIPERDTDDKIYNTATVYSPDGWCCTAYIMLCAYSCVHPGKLVAIHRKVHLFDIDIPGKITFKVHHVLRDMFRSLKVVCTGKRDAYWWGRDELV